MSQPRFWHNPKDQPGLLSLILRPLSKIYGAKTAHRIQNGLYENLPVPVISIGNINIGGSGKTPAVITVLSMLQAMGIKPHVISRGYGGSIRTATRVEPKVHSADEVGDEPLLLSAFGPAWVSRDRAEGARAAVQAGADAIILDDALQNPALHKDLSITVVDAATGFGNGCVLPAGPLREPVKKGLGRTDFLLLVGTESDCAALKSKSPEIQNVPMLQGRIEPLQTGMDWRGLRVFAFAGIGHPEKFFATLVSLGAEVVGTRRFGDHQKLPLAILKRLEAEAAAASAQLVTTEKDAVRLAKSYQQKVLTLPVRMMLVDDRPLREKLDSLFQLSV